MILGQDLDNREVLPGISAHFLVKDPPIARLVSLVQYLAPYVKEFVIVDTGSDPIDVERMRDFGKPSGTDVRVIEATFTDFSTARNIGLAEHRYEWTLILDPDEFPSHAMMQHVIHVTSPEGMSETPNVMGWVYWTYNWWDGILGEDAPYHWHTRLFKTKGSYFYRPVHELVKVCGVDELRIRETVSLPHAPKNAYLIHSKTSEDGAKGAKLYATLEQS